MGYEKKEATVLEEVSQEQEENKQEKKEETPQKICIYICGQVKNPGVYQLEEGSRVYQVIEAAGGFTKDASLYAVNQAEKIEDGQQIYVPSFQEQEDSSSGNVKDGRIDINLATLEELMTLPGIGQSKAESIIQYREENGKFKKPEDLMKIEGIKSGVFNKIKDKIVIR